MNERTKYPYIEGKTLLVDLNDLCKILQVGRSKAREIAELAGARVDLSSRKIARYNVQKIKNYINSVTY